MKILRGLASGQVLQRRGRRGADARLRGSSTGEGRVLATVYAERAIVPGWKGKPVGHTRGGRLVAALRDIPVGGPYRLHLSCGADSLLIEDFFVGDVWLLAGQSNMQGAGNLASPSRPHALVRAFSLAHEWRLAEDPLHLLSESPDPCHYGKIRLSRGTALRSVWNSGKGTGPGIFFGTEMVKRTGVAQGLICTAHGGTSLKQWMPSAGKPGGSSLYHSMLASVRATGQPLRGILWYQGESDANAENAPLYGGRMVRLIRAVRKDLGQSALHWIMVQLARSFTANNPTPWNLIQEQQRRLPEKIPHLHVVSAIDLPMDDALHLGSDALPRLGVRLARAAQGERLPRLGKIQAIAGKVPNERLIKVRFDGVKGELAATGEPQGFCAVNSRGKMVPLVYRIRTKQKSVILHLKDSAREGELRVAHGLGAFPFCNITDARDLALPVFAPMDVEETQALLPFVMNWKVRPPSPALGSLRQLVTERAFAECQFQVKSYEHGDGFVCEHEVWQDAPGVAVFSSALELPEAMHLKFLMGYDGPFRVWVNGLPFFTDLQGAPPAVRDHARKECRLPAGRHTLHVAMDTMGGNAWGFFLRFERRDLTERQIGSGRYLRPIYSA